MSNNLYFKWKDLYICSGSSSRMRKQITKVKQMIKKLIKRFKKINYLSYDELHNLLYNGIDMRFHKPVILERWK